LRVEIRGFTGISCLGADRKTQVAAAQSGRTGLTASVPESLVAGPGVIAGWVDRYCDDPMGIYKLSDRVLEQLEASCPLTAAERAETGVFVGTTTGQTPIEELPAIAKIRAGLPWKSEFLSGGPGPIASHVARRFGSRGPLCTFTTACTSTGVALMMALRALRLGRVPRALVFGVDLVMKNSIEGFRLLQLYSEKACRPFDKDRDGLNFGEAGVAMVLEPAGETPRSRFELLDGAIAHDPSHIAAGSSGGKTAAAVMRQALERSRVAPRELVAVKAHGTGTPTNDLSELRGMVAAFDGAPPPFLSWKGFIGHTVGSSAAMEQVLSMWCLEEGFLPASAGFASPTEEVSLAPLTAPLSTGGRPGAYLFNAFGFGGTAVSYVVADRGARS
jgi:3-oxoacyl-(acyl-carrier-protein) synthase